MIDDYNVGYQLGARAGGLAFLFIGDDDYIRDISTQTPKAIVSTGEFPLLKIKKGEIAREYVRFVNGGSMTVRKANPAGYTVGVFGYRSGQPVPIVNHVGLIVPGPQNVSVCDMKDNPVEDFRDLDYGQHYKVEWYEGVKYNESEEIANWRCYEYDDEVIELPMELTKENYGAIVLDLEPGFYVCGSEVFEVVEE